jgi:hypothetical protein
MMEKIYAQRTFLSKRYPAVIYTATIYWGGTMQNPNATCTCPLGTFQRKLCGHVAQMWDELDSFGKQSVIHHDEIVAKPWWRGK